MGIGYASVPLYTSAAREIKPDEGMENVLKEVLGHAMLYICLAMSLAIPLAIFPQ